MRIGALALLVIAAAASARDPEYDRVLDAYKAGRWEELERLAGAFLEEKPDYRFAHSIRFMVADSLRRRKRYAAAAQAFADYLRRHPDETLAGRSRRAHLQCLNELRRYEDALRLSEAYLAASKGARHIHGVRFERAAALEGLRRFPEAVAEFRRTGGGFAERAAYRSGRALFRARRIDEARKELRAFLERYPDSRRAASAREYLERIDPERREVRGGVVVDYRGKYRDDPRFLAIREGLPARRARALRRIGEVLGEEIEDDFLVRFEDAGADRSGRWAEVRAERVGERMRPILILYTEPLVLGAHDLDRTLVHELYHCVQRDRLGEESHLATPTWVREGTALYVAGQTGERARILARYLGANPDIDAMARLVDGLEGRHTLEDYAEDALAFEAVQVRHGRERARALLRRLLRTNDAKAAIRDVLGESWTDFAAAAEEHARSRLAPLVEEGRDRVHALLRLVRSRRYEEALALPPVGGVYDAEAEYLLSLALHRTGRNEEALRRLRERFLSRFRTSTRLDDALLLELRILKALGSPEFREAAARARRDLEPYRVYPDVLEVLE